MSKKYSKERLRQLRNDIPISILIAEFLKLPSKVSEGYFRFLCPICSEFVTATNPKTNLARCFRCEKNFNTIDMTMTVKRFTFTQAVEYLDDIVIIESL
jgi:DNA primase